MRQYADWRMAGHIRGALVMAIAAGVGALFGGLT